MMKSIISYLSTDFLLPNKIFLRIIVFFATLLLTLLATKVSVKIARSTNLLDYPRREPHKIHKKAIPLAGGITFSFILLALFLFFHIFGFYSFEFYLPAAFILIFVIGILDDANNLPPKAKLLGQFAASLILVLGDHRAVVFSSDFANIFLTIVWYVGIMNAFNFIDSADGLLLGVANIIGASIFLATLFFPQDILNLFSISLLALLIGLYTQNKKPAKLFLGDSGALLLGLLFGVIVLKFNPLGFDNTTSWITPILIMAFPIFDTTLVVIHRWLTKTPIYQAALDHTYHRLRKYTKRQSAPYLFIFGITVLSNFLAIINLFLPNLLAFTLFGITLASGLLLIVLFEKFLPA